MIHKFALIFAILFILGATYAQEVTPVSYLDASVPIPDDMARPAPAAGSSAAANPPGFVWLPEAEAVSYTLQYSQNKDFTSATTVDLKPNAHQPTAALKPGTWHWRYRAVFADGKTSAWSSMRTFTMSKDAVKLTIPPIQEIAARMKSSRPRIFVRQEGLEELRQSRFGMRKERWEAFEETLESKKGVALWPEPAGYPATGRTPELWREHYREIRVMTGAMEMLAFGYMASGKREYADEAKRIMLHLATWDPNGSSSYLREDEMAMPIAHSTCRAYDWIYDTFTPEERAKVLEMMSARLSELYMIVTKGPYAVKPYGSHLQRALMFLGEGSVSFMGEIEGCEEWLEYVLTCYSCIYPPWGGADGSYMEGPWYWGSYISWALQFVDVLQTATGVDLYGKPFFRNTGWYVLYCTPPFFKMQPFGDGAWFTPSSTLKNNMYRFASVYDNPYFRWYADNHPSELPNSHIMYLWQDESIKAKPPTDLPPSRVFYDAGLVAMHSNLTGGEDSVSLLMRSSPGGAWSHSFADQNGFYLQAFGEALAIPSGYRPFYGDDHHRTWTWETRSCNSILVNGQGQMTRTRASQGRISDALFSPQFDYACGDATKAYGGKLDKFLRHVIFLRPGYFVLVDELKAPESSTFDWLLHAWEKIDVTPASCRLTISKGDARLLVQFTEPEKLTFSQTDQFSAPTTNNPDLANQWHLTASTTPSRERSFVTALYPYKAGEEGSLPVIERIDAPGVYGVSVKSVDGEDLVLLNRFASPMIVENIKADAHIAALRDSGKAVFLQDGKSISINRVEFVSADSPVTLSMAMSRGKRSLVVKCDQPTQLRLKIEQLPSARITVRIVKGRDGRTRIVEDKPNPHIFYGTVKVNGKRAGPTAYSFNDEISTLTLKLESGEHRVDIVATPPI